MNINRPLVPGWLKKAEQQLLLNKPGIWSTRTHLVLYYGILFMAFLTGLCFLENTDIRANATSSWWIGFVSIISVIGFTVWLIYLLRFNVFKKYGIIHPLYSLTSFILYFISTGIIVLFTYVPPVVESIRANMAYGDEEVVQDMNDINLKLCQVEYEALQVKWECDSVIIREKIEPDGVVYYDVKDTVTDTVGLAPGHYMFYDSADFKVRLSTTDSVIKVNDSFYILFKTPNYAFVSTYVGDINTRTKLLSSFNIYSMVFKKPPPANREAISKELAALIHKYHYEERFETYMPHVQYNPRTTAFEKVNEQYHLSDVRNNFYNVTIKKYRWSASNMPEYLRVFYYVTLGITLLIFIFRHTTVKTFFLSLLTAVLLIIFTALAMSMSATGESAFLAWIIAYFLVFCIGAASTWVLSRRRAVSGILINLFVFLAPIFPLLIVGWYYFWKSEQSYNKGIPPVFPNMYEHILYAEIGGSLLFLVYLALFINKMYRRWYSLPEE